jgi:CheY-like chemotaxis protein
MNNPAAHPVPTRFQPKVLLLCDRPLDAAAWAQALAFHHIDAIQAASADEGLRRWAELIPDLIVIDLPGEAGLEVCRRLSPEAAIPLLVLLDEPDEAASLQAYRAGAASPSPAGTKNCTSNRAAPRVSEGPSQLGGTGVSWIVTGRRFPSFGARWESTRAPATVAKQNSPTASPATASSQGFSCTDFEALRRISSILSSPGGTDFHRG